MVIRDLIAIGASTGGTDAILEVVKDLPAETPGIVVTQHIEAHIELEEVNALEAIPRLVADDP